MSTLRKLDFIAKHGKEVPNHVYHEAIDKALNDEDYIVRLSAIRHPKVTKEHLDKALNDENGYIRRAAIRHPNATNEHIDKALNDEEWHVRDIAKERLSSIK